jgi:hypothetical protein
MGLALLAGCSSRRTVVVTQEFPRQVDIEVEVFDPETNLVWEGVAIRILESFQEWNGCTCPNPRTDEWFFTDANGLVVLTSHDLAAAEIGFQEDNFGRAVLSPHADEDEAFVLIELDALGFTPVQVDVPLSWDEPKVFVSIPFEPDEGLSAAASTARPGGPRKAPPPGRAVVSLHRLE